MDFLENIAIIVLLLLCILTVAGIVLGVGQLIYMLTGSLLAVFFGLLVFLAVIVGVFVTLVERAHGG